MTDINHQIDQFNKKYKIGTKGFLLLDGVDQPIRTEVRAKATDLCGTAAAWFEGVRGAYDIDRFIPQEQSGQEIWKPIKTAPKDGTEFIITNGFTVCTAMYYESHVQNYYPFFACSSDGEIVNHGRDHETVPYYIIEPTHWQPLPNPPLKEGL